MPVHTVLGALLLACWTGITVALSIKRLRRRPTTLPDRAKSPDDFMRRLIPKLRELERTSDWYRDEARELARAFEWLIAHPEVTRRPPCTGDRTQDREIVAQWLYDHARGPAFTAPSWTRMFSESLAWVLRHRYRISDKSLNAAQRAMRLEFRARLQAKTRD